MEESSLQANAYKVPALTTEPHAGRICKRNRGPEIPIT